MSLGRAGNRSLVGRADWTYELPPVTGDSVWLEEYLVYDREGEPAGKVFAVLEHGGRRYLGVEREHLPLRHDRRAVPFDAVREVDHEHVGVHLSLSAAELDEALELDPAKGIEQGGDARRVATAPAEETPRRLDAGAAGSVDNPIVIVAGMLLVVTTILTFTAVVVYGAHPTTPRLALFALPVASLLLTAVLSYRAWAVPWERRIEGRRHPQR